MVKRKRILALVMLVGALAFGALAVWIQYDLRSFVRMDGCKYNRYAQQLDLSGRQNVEFSKLPRFYHLRQLDLRGTGLTLEQYDWLQAQMPKCSIAWQVPFQGKALDLSTQTLTVSSLTQGDVAALTHLPALREVDAEGSGDYAALEALVSALPECTVRYKVAVDGKQWDAHTEQLELGRLNLTELRETLPYLHDLRQITLTGALPQKEALEELEEAFPNIRVLLALPDRVLPLGRGSRELDLSGAELSLEEAQRLIACCPNLTRVEVQGTSLSQQDIMELCADHPQVFFLWDVPIGGLTIPSDAEEADLSGEQLDSTEAVERMLPYLPKLKKVIMCDCGIPDEEMDALNKRYDSIRFVWMVHIGRVSVRTDADFFAPVVTREHVYENQMEPLKYCTDLVAIDLGHMAVYTCTWAENMPKLQYLILADTGVTDISPLANHDRLVFLELFMTAVRDYSPLLSCKNLEDLNLCYTFGSAEPVKQMTWLKRLWWDGNPYETKGLEEYLPDTECNFASGSSTGGTWRLGQRCKEQRDILGMPYLVG